TTRILKEGELLHGPTATYTVLQLLCEGCFAEVAKCQNLTDQQIVAIKVLNKSEEKELTRRELGVLMALTLLDSEVDSVIKYHEHFHHMGHTCMVFEMLDMNLTEFMESRHWAPLKCHEIRAIAKQLLGALEALNNLGFTHTDIKPENVMLADAVNRPFRVKLTDFGLAVPVLTIKPGTWMQPKGYRAPEVSFSFHLSEAVDMWGLACVLVYLYLGRHMFLSGCENHTLRNGIFTKNFFIQEEAADGSTQLRMRTPEEYTAVSGINTSHCFSLLASLDELLHIQMFHMDWNRRVTAQQALQLPFLTMSHLSEDPDCKQYLIASRQAMNFDLVKTIEAEMESVGPTARLLPIDLKRPSSLGRLLWWRSS
uniref:Protein kinase domain-containing protein n=1 Tax=Salarias fasciatus TaxID=181472 RepID=A0A672JK57_SALFA